MNALVTGISGFVGANLAQGLANESHNVVGIIRDLKPQSPLARLNMGNKVNIIFGDVRNQELIERAISEYAVDTIFHMAASAIVGYAQRAPAQAINNNIASTIAVLEAARVCGKLKSIVIQTSDKVYGPQDPPLKENMPLVADEPYSASKAACDIIAHAYHSVYGLPIIVTRPCNLYGPGDTHSRVVPNTIQACLRGESPIIFTKNDRREYLFIDDLIDAFLMLSAEDQTGPFNIGGGAIKNNGDVVMEILKSFPGLTPSHAEPPAIREIPRQWLQCDRIKSLGWKPETSFSVGIKKTIEWWREQ